MKLTSIIVEDEETSREILKYYLKKYCPNVLIVGEASNVDEALVLIRNNSLDLVFLDVEMPEISGIDFIKTLSNPPRVIVTTSRSDFAAEAFGIDAVDFILKPVLVNQVIKALQKYKQLESTDDIVPVAPSATSIFVKVALIGLCA